MSVDNVKLGHADLTYNDTAVGLTKGGTTISIAPEFYEKTVDKFGNTPVGVSEIGTRVEVKTIVSEFTLDNIKAAIANAELQSGTTVDQVNIGKQAGAALTGAELVIHPKAMGSDTSMDITIHKAVLISAIEINFSNEDQTGYEITFLALVDETKDDGSHLLQIGTAD